MSGLALGVLLATSCASVQRRERTMVGVEGAYARTEERSFDCNGDVVSRQVHDQVGGSVEVRHETSGALYGGGRVTGLRGTLDEAEGMRVDPGAAPYWLAAASGYFGGDTEGSGHELGVTLLLRPRARGDQMVVSPWPWYRLRLGAYRGFSWEVLFGSDRALLFDGRIGSTGPAFRGDFGVLRAGFGFGGRHVLDQEAGERDYAFGARRQYADLLLYAEGSFRLADTLLLDVAVQAGSQLPTVRFGLSWVVERPDRAPPVPAPEYPPVRRELTPPPRPSPRAPPPRPPAERGGPEHGAGLDAPSPR